MAKQTKDKIRWVLPDWKAVDHWIQHRAAQGIRCCVDVLGEYSRSKASARKAAEGYLQGVDHLRGLPGKPSLAIKLTALGLTFDADETQHLLEEIVHRADDLDVPVEIDMEGRPLVERTLTMVRALPRGPLPRVVAVQAYLDRSAQDVADLTAEGFTVRLVKGAYAGDLDDFASIRQAFVELFHALTRSERAFCAGTHDPQLLTELGDTPQVEWGFLMGLSDETKLSMAVSGKRVAEYVPVGEALEAYVRRRHAYLAALAASGRHPAP